MLLSILLSTATCPTIASLPFPQQIAAVESVLAKSSSGAAIAVAGEGIDRPYAVAVGYADARSGRLMTADTPLRIASNTKTFVAVTVLKLQETGKIDLEATIDRLADPKLVEILRSDGYAVDSITVRHLLSHSGGLYDQGADPRFIPLVLANPDHVWTRSELVKLATGYGDPIAPPGSEYRYSDAGYIILGDIIERVTKRTLATAVRDAINYNKIGLKATWWELSESPPKGIAARARQHIRGKDESDVHPSYDLYGGGGLLMSARDMAIFMAALFEGKIFKHEQTLELMTRQGTHTYAERYRIGLQAKQGPSGPIYYHSGFWGTGVYYDPATKKAVAGLATEQKAYRAEIVPLIEQVLGLTPSTAACQTNGG